MHIPDRSHILDSLASAPKASADQPAQYNIRRLSYEIMARAGESCTWTNEQQAQITLGASRAGEYVSYELLVQEANDNDIHRYVYHSIANGILHAYPMFEWHYDEKTDALRSPVEQFLLSGPSHDKVPDTDIENKIQKLFPQIGRHIIIEAIAESLPEFKQEIYLRYLATNDPDTRKAIVNELYYKASEISTFIDSRDAFDYAFITDLNDFRIAQKQLQPKSTSAEQ